MATILTRAIPSSGEQLPVVGLGTWQTFDVSPDSAELSRLEPVLQSFVDAGGSLVDSSPMYGRAEAAIGTLAARLGIQPRLFVATKVWTTGRQAGVRQMDASMDKLGVRRVDLMQVHNLVDVETQLDTLREWKAEGRVRYLGVTHYAASGHAAVAKILETHDVDFVQINYSIAEREAERRILPLARERGIAVLVNRPFAEGSLFRRLQSRTLPAWAREIDCESWAELLLKFVIAHPAVTCVIPATSSVDHLRANMRAGTGRLPDEGLRARIAGEGD